MSGSCNRIGTGWTRVGLTILLTVGGCGGSKPTPSQDGQLPSDGVAEAGMPSDKYVAMGSSVAAGPGIPDSVPGQSCGRSTNNYAHLIATDMGLDLTEVSCSGAIIDNIASVPQGTNPLQIAALTPDTKVVTISMGGNDVSYSASLITCGQDGANGTACLGTDVDAAAIAQMMVVEQSKLVAMLNAVKQAALNASVFLVANSMMLPDPALPCPPRAPFQAVDATFLGMLGKNLQDAFVGAAQEAGVHFVDVYSASQGHDVCAPDGQRWVEGQTPPAVVPYYHPNATGMRAQADLIEAEIRRTL